MTAGASRSNARACRATSSSPRSKASTTAPLPKALKGLELKIAREDLPETEDDEFYQADLIGLAVVDASGREIGEVLGFQNFGAGELIEIKRDRAPLELRALHQRHGAGRRHRVKAASSFPKRASRSSPPTTAKKSGAMTWAATVLTVLPEMFPGPLGMSLSGKALAEDRWSLETIDIRKFATTRYGSVDDTPAGGGPGMVMRPDILGAAIDTRRARRPPADPACRRAGVRLTQARARELAKGPGAVLVCGRFEGVDERVIEARALEEISIGDYVLSGGEIAAMTLIDAVVRLLPGVVGAEASLEEESFEQDLLEYPQYTRPQTWEGREIPAVLTSGHHKRIARVAPRSSRSKSRNPAAPICGTPISVARGTAISKQ